MHSIRILYSGELRLFVYEEVQGFNGKKIINPLQSIHRILNYSSTFYNQYTEFLISKLFYLQEHKVKQITAGLIHYLGLLGHSKARINHTTGPNVLGVDFIFKCALNISSLFHLLYLIFI